MREEDLKSQVSGENDRSMQLAAAKKGSVELIFKSHDSISYSVVSRQTSSSLTVIVCPGGGVLPLTMSEEGLT